MDCNPDLKISKRVNFAKLGTVNSIETGSTKLKRKILRAREFQSIDLNDFVSKKCGELILESSTNRNQNGRNDDLLVPLHFLLKLGRCIGIIPLSGIWNTNFENFRFRWISSATATNISLCILLGVNAILGFYDLYQIYRNSGNASLLAMESQTPVYYLFGLISYLLFLLRSEKLVDIFANWKRISQNLIFAEEDRHGQKHVKRISLIILIFCVVQDGLNDLRLFPIIPRTPEQILKEKNFSPMETYYYRNHNLFHNLIPYNFTFAFFLFISHKFALLAWSYLDLMIIILCRLLYFKFKVLYLETKRRITQKKPGGFWSQVRKDHLNLCKLVDVFEAFLSPMIFASYSMNIYSVCMQLNQGLTPTTDSSVLKTIYSTGAIFHLIVRMFLISIAGARVNEFAHKITICIQKCPSEEYTREVDRLERMLAGGSVGLTGMGCFILRREFLLVVISVCFTFEIVLLQASGITGTVASS